MKIVLEMKYSDIWKDISLNRAQIRLCSKTIAAALPSATLHQ